MTVTEQKYLQQSDRSKTHQRTHLREMHINGALISEPQHSFINVELNLHVLQSLSLYIIWLYYIKTGLNTYHQLRCKTSNIIPGRGHPIHHPRHWIVCVTVIWIHTSIKLVLSPSHIIRRGY